MNAFHSTPSIIYFQHVSRPIVPFAFLFRLMNPTDVFIDADVYIIESKLLVTGTYLQHPPVLRRLDDLYLHFH